MIQKIEDNINTSFEVRGIDTKLSMFMIQDKIRTNIRILFKDLLVKIISKHLILIFGETIMIHGDHIYQMTQKKYMIYLIILKGQFKSEEHLQRVT